MIGSLFKDLPPISSTEKSESEAVAEDSSYRTDSDDYLLTALPVVQKIVRRKTVFSWHSEASDLVQKVALRLLQWRKKYQEKSEKMSQDEWQSFAAKTAYNEINRHNSNSSFQTEVPIESENEVIAQDSLLEGQSDAEVFSLARVVWQETCNLSLRQRRAFLLHSQKLIIDFQNIGITDEEIAGSLEISVGEWNDLRVNIPLTNIQIAELTFKKGRHKSLESQANSVKKARYEARAKMRRITDK